MPAGFYPAFQPTLPARGATRPPRAELPAQVHISTHTPRTGSDCSQSCPWASPCYFNPHSPHGERRCCWAARQRREVFQPTLPARGATAGQCQSSRQSAISTHTPRTGSDALGFFSIIFDGISTHTPRTGSDDSIAPTGDVHGISTHTPRTGSDTRDGTMRVSKYISTHTPRTGSDPRRGRTRRRKGISTHTPRTGSDTIPLFPAFV